MKMITVDRCCCFGLETGGLIIAWLNLIGDVLIAILSLFAIIFLSIYNCNDLQNLHNAQFTRDELEICPTIRGVAIGGCVFLIALSIGFGYISWMCIKGIKARDHFRVKPLMILLAITAVLSIFQVLSFSVHGVFNGIIGAAISAYYFIVLYSIYSLFKREYETGGNRHQLQQAGKV